MEACHNQFMLHELSSSTLNVHRSYCPDPRQEFRLALQNRTPNACHLPLPALAQWRSQDQL